MKRSRTALRPQSPHLERLTRLIDEALAKALRPAAGSPRLLSQAMRYCVGSGGKRFRPLLCLGACEAVGGRIRQALPACCAIEFIHTYSLVHDDLPAMDNADERRGQLSCHRRFGEATAILVGDALLTRAFELLSVNGTPNTLAILRTLGQASGTAGLIGGQVLDLECGVPAPPARRSLSPGRAARAGGGPGRSSEFGVKRLEEIAKRKTAALITASVMVGALAARASARDLHHLQQYGTRLGLAFQLLDDARDRDGLAKVMDPEALRRRAFRLIAQAKQRAAPFGRRAAALHGLADWLDASA